VTRELVIASKNKGKIREIREIYADLPLAVIEARDLPEVVEDGASFSENARRKAVAIARYTGKWALADDSGLEVDALEGAPGIHSARWSGGGDEANNDKLLAELRDVPAPARTARYRAVVVVATPDGNREETVAQLGRLGIPQEIADVVRNARALADYVIVTIHAHNQSEYLKIFAQAMIDAGADVFVGHGPHYLTGIEIYKGKPIMYSLGDFIFQNETLLRLPYDNYEPYGFGDDMGKWVADFNAARYNNETTGFPVNREIWESVVAMPTYDDGRLVSLELHPITLGFGKPAAVRGRPMLADRELGQKIIQDLIDRSRPHGTTILWDAGRGVGVVKVPS